MASFLRFIFGTRYGQRAKIIEIKNKEIGNVYNMKLSRTICKVGDYICTVGTKSLWAKIF